MVQTLKVYEAGICSISLNTNNSTESFINEGNYDLGDEWD